MSVVTNIIFTIGDSRDEYLIQEVQKFKWNIRAAKGLPQPDGSYELIEYYSPREMNLSKLDNNGCGDTKIFEASMWWGGFNRLPLHEFVTYCRELPWIHPEDVQIIFKEEEDDRFRIIDMQTNTIKIESNEPPKNIPGIGN